MRLAAAAPAKGWRETRQSHPPASALYVFCLPRSYGHKDAPYLSAPAPLPDIRYVLASHGSGRLSGGTGTFRPSPSPTSLPPPASVLLSTVVLSSSPHSSRFLSLLPASMIFVIRQLHFSTTRALSPAIIYFPKPLEFLDLHFH